jgi:hypothetical protein
LEDLGSNIVSKKKKLLRSPLISFLHNLSPRGHTIRPFLYNLHLGIIS